MAEDDPFDVDAFLDGYRAPVETVVIYQRADLLGEHTRLETEMAEVIEAGESDDDGHLERVRELSERMEAVKAELEASARDFAFTSISHEDWYGLMGEHPPTDDERRTTPNAAVGAEFQIRTLAACSRDPKLTVAQARKMRKMRADDFDRCWIAVVACNEGPVTVPKFGMGTAAAQLFAKHSTNRKARRSRGRSGAAANGKASRSTSTTGKGG